MRLRVLTAADLHQSRRHFQWLCDEVKSKRPDLVAFVGDFLSDSAAGAGDQIRTEEAAHILSGLCCPQLVFVRGRNRVCRQGLPWRRSRGNLKS